jgi:ribosomal protein L40E
MANCTYCGKNLSPNATRCTSCGETNIRLTKKERNSVNLQSSLFRWSAIGFLFGVFGNPFGIGYGFLTIIVSGLLMAFIFAAIVLLLEYFWNRFFG